MPREAASDAARVEVTRRREPVRVTALPLSAAQQVFRREATARQLALSGFPAGYPLTGTRRDRVTQIGNAVCPPVACWIARQIARAA